MPKKKKDIGRQDESKLPLDLLGRNPFVNQVFQIANVFHLQKKTACYAINGLWGSGKTYVLNKLEEKLREPGRAEGKYEFLVLRYNCWEYDYYDEPLLSIVATLLDALDQYQLKDETKAKLKSAFRAVANLLLNGFISYVDNKTGGAGTKIIEVVDAYEEGKEEYLSKLEAFNDKLPFQKAMELLREQIVFLSQEHTVIFLVDELDRCLPEYAIRVLERLHHLFEDINNVQLIFSVDRPQLEHVVKELYGPSANSAAYLKKFISFELKLDLGTLTSVFDKDYNSELDGDFDKRFDSYVTMFLPPSENEAEEIAEFKRHILDGIDIRKRIALVEKAELIHRMIWPREKDASAHDLCAELFLTVFYEATLLDPNNNGGIIAFEKQSFENWRKMVVSKFMIPVVSFPLLPCFSVLNDIYGDNYFHGEKIFWESSNGSIACDADTLYGKILCGYRIALNDRNTSQETLSAFWGLLKIME